MDVTADQFLAGSAFPINKNAAVGWSNDSDLLAQRLRGHAFTDDIESFFELMPEQVVGSLETPMRESIAGGEQRVFERKGLFDEVIGSEFCRTDRSCDRRVTGNHDDVSPGRFLA